MELDSWDELYATHDKYKFMGLLAVTIDPVDELVTKAMTEETVTETAAPVTNEVKVEEAIPA